MEAAEPTTESEWHNADFGRRVVACLIDTAIAGAGALSICLAATEADSAVLQGLAVVASFIWGPLYHICPPALLG